MMIREEALNVLMNVAPLLRDGTRFLGQEHEEQFHKAYEMAMDALRQPDRKKEELSIEEVAYELGISNIQPAAYWYDFLIRFYACGFRAVRRD